MALDAKPKVDKIHLHVSAKEPRRTQQQWAHFYPMLVNLLSLYEMCPGDFRLRFSESPWTLFQESVNSCWCDSPLWRIGLQLVSLMFVLIQQRSTKFCQTTKKRIFATHKMKLFVSTHQGWHKSSIISFTTVHTSTTLNYLKELHCDCKVHKDNKKTASQCERWHENDDSCRSSLWLQHHNSWAFFAKKGNKGTTRIREWCHMQFVCQHVNTGPCPSCIKFITALVTISLLFDSKTWLWVLNVTRKWKLESWDALKWGE